MAQRQTESLTDRRRASSVAHNIRGLLGPKIRNVVLRARSKPASGVVLQKPPERSIANGPADVRHEPLEEPNIMHRNEDRAKHFACKKEMPDRPAGKRAAGIAVAAGLDRPAIGSVLAGLETNWSIASKRIGIAPVSRRQHAIEHINARGDGGGNIAREPDSHQITRLFGRKHRRGGLQHTLHRLKPLADGQPAYCVARKVHFHQSSCAPLAQRDVRSSLYDPKQRLIALPLM